MELSDPEHFLWKRNRRNVRRRTDMNKLHIEVSRDNCDRISVDNMSTSSSNDSFCVESEGDNLKNTVVTGKNDFNESKTVPPVALDCEMVGVGDEKTSALA